jgi:DNA-binding transcriptional LysR family regulator
MALDLEALRTFLKVAELGSFTRAGTQLGMSKSRASLHVQALEEQLGVRLFQRSTRVVRLTPDGEELLPRARKLLVEAEEVTALFDAPTAIRGRMRVDLPVGFARDVIFPRLPELLAKNPDLELLLSTTDRRVDVVREGFDCVMRVGALSDSGLIAKRLGFVTMANAASRAYLDRYGVPRSIEALNEHLLVHYSSTLGAEEPTFEYFDGTQYQQHVMRSVITVNSSEAFQSACLAGLGIIQAPRTGLTPLFKSKRLVEVLPAFTCEPMPVWLIHGYGRTVPRRVRALMTFLADVMAPFLSV